MDHEEWIIDPELINSVPGTNNCRKTIPPSF
jgi:hypothetical protein